MEARVEPGSGSGGMAKLSQAADSNVAIAIRNLAARFGTREILRDISLDIPRGETSVILGGSGCGKSTLLRMIV